MEKEKYVNVVIDTIVFEEWDIVTSSTCRYEMGEV